MGYENIAVKVSRFHILMVESKEHENNIYGLPFSIVNDWIALLCPVKVWVADKLGELGMTLHKSIYP